MLKKIMFVMVIVSVCLLGCDNNGDGLIDVDGKYMYDYHKLKWTFNNNGGNGAIDSISETFTYKSPYGCESYTGNEHGTGIVNTKEVFLPYVSGMNRNDFIFCGWSKDPYGLKDNYQEGSNSVPLFGYYRAEIYNHVYKENLIVTWYAIWRQKHTVSFEANGGSGTMGNISYVLGNPLQHDVDCQYLDVGYSYVGNIVNEAAGYYGNQNQEWIYIESGFYKESNGFKIYPESFNTKADGTGTKIEKNYKDGKYQYGISYKILGDDLTLYAIWQ